MCIGVVMLNRRRPVAIFPTELFHPVSPLLAFPTGQPGEVYISIPQVCGTLLSVSLSLQVVSAVLCGL